MSNSESELARALFSPRSVALIGASSNPSSNSARPLSYLLKHGFTGAIYPVNPSVNAIGDIPCYPSVRDLPGPVDHAFIMVRADRVAETVRACATAGVTCATILSDGFAESGPEGRAREAALIRLARETGIRLLGPNSIGVIDTGGFTCSANATLAMAHLSRGGYGVISQSGSMIGALLSQGEARGIGYSSLVSVGNEADLKVGEIGALMVDDPRCKALLLFLESIQDRAALTAFARKAEAAGKPVLAYKLGRSKAGRDLAATHTGALAGDDATAEALLAHLGIARVRILETLFEAPPLFFGAATGAPETKGKRVAVVTTTGGGGAMVVDMLAGAAMELAPPLSEIQRSLSSHGISGGGSGLIDLTLAGTRPELVRSVLSSLMDSDQVDAIAMVIGSSSQFHPELAVAPLRGFAEAAKPLGIYLVPAADQSRRILTEEGLAVFRTAESCVEGLRARLFRRSPQADVAPDMDLADQLNRALEASDAAILDEVSSRQICDLLGITGPDGGLATSAAEAREIFHRLGGPVVLKIVSADIPHKSDTGGLILGLTDADAVGSGFEELMRGQAAAHPGAVLKGVLVQKMERGGSAEALIGYRMDPSMGPMVMLGAGGTLAEILDDTTMRVAPVSLAIAREMINEVRFLRAARGYRNRAAGDLEALAETIVALSRLAHCGTVREAEINPLMIREQGQGVRALDALVVTHGATAQETTDSDRKEAG